MNLTNSTNLVFKRMLHNKYESFSEYQFYNKLEYVENMILIQQFKQKYKNVWHATIEFQPKMGLLYCEVDELVYIVLLVLSEYVYHYEFEIGKFSVLFSVTDPDHIIEDFSYTVGYATTLSKSISQIDVPDRGVYNEFYNKMSTLSEKYPNLLIKKICIIIYLTEHKEKAYTLKNNVIKRLLFNAIFLSPECVEPRVTPSMAKKPPIPDYITALKLQGVKHLKGFIVADFETIPYPMDLNTSDKELKTFPSNDALVEESFEDEMYLINEDSPTNPLDITHINKERKKKERGRIKKKERGRIKKSSQASITDVEKSHITDDDVEKSHVVYAAGFLVVKPGEKVVAKPDHSIDKPDHSIDKPDHSIETYYIDEYSTIEPSFRKRSQLLIREFLERLVQVANKTKIRTVYFHNLSRFDGFFLLEYFINSGDHLIFKPLMRNHALYEIKVYIEKKLVYKIRDSYFLLTGSLNDLAQNLCPDIGSKDEFDHSSLKVEELKSQEKKKEIIDYLRQDVRLLGGVMQKAQEIYYEKFQVDIVNNLTISSLALSIYRMNYYDPNKTPIYLPNQNQDQFIRLGYYGGHSDVYYPIGRKMYVYDVNSLYPYIMGHFPMPCGPAVWYDSFSGINLSDKIGFVKAYVICPSSMDRPFLPYRNSNKKKDQTLIFPTGEFVGVYYTAELEYAKKIGYLIHPICGYLFDNKTECNPFETFVKDLYDSRLEAKKDDKNAIAFIYKLIMNSLYGRFGINPESTVTEICNYERYSYLIKNEKKLSYWAEAYPDTKYVINYKVNTEKSDEWKPPRNSAVHIAAAITACARIHMYPYISRRDCVYTDTDSAFLLNPLPEEDVSPDIIGKLKLEKEVKKGIFLAPKAYALVYYNGDKTIKHKGRGKDFVDLTWFKHQLKDLSRVFEKVYLNKFYPDRKRFQLCIKKTKYLLTIPDSKKRDKILNSKNLWIKTKPKHIIDYGNERKTCEQINQTIAEIKQSQIHSVLKNANTSRIEMEKREKMLVAKEKMLVAKEKMLVAKDKKLVAMAEEIKRAKKGIIKDTKEAKFDMEREEDSIKKPPS